MKGLVFTIVILMILSCFVPLSAQESSPMTLGEITVTAEKFPSKEKESSRFVTIISAEELKLTGANNLIDALRRTGVFGYKAFAPLGISYGGVNSELVVRGIPDGELVLINGLPVQGAAGHGYSLNGILLDQIERVEILRGAASTLYGADAMTGTINIITKKPVKRQASISAEIGDFEYHNHSVNLFNSHGQP